MPWELFWGGGGPQTDIGGGQVLRQCLGAAREVPRGLRVPAAGGFFDPLCVLLRGGIYITSK